MWCVENCLCKYFKFSVFNEQDIDLNDENILFTEKTFIKPEGLQWLCGNTEANPGTTRNPK